MTLDKLNEILKDCKNGFISKNTARELIWGQPFDGVTERIKPTTEESLAVQPLPIDSAPKYTRTLVYCQRPQVNTGWWQIAEYDEEIGEWLDDAVDGEICLFKPTCWLPLPPAPTQPNQ